MADYFEDILGATDFTLSSIQTNEAEEEQQDEKEPTGKAISIVNLSAKTKLIYERKLSHEKSEFEIVGVKNPKKQSGNDSLSFSYVNYEVVIRKSDNNVFSVWRRFNDFYKLRCRLRVLFPLCIVPPLPEKAMTRFSEAVISYRARELGRFLKRVLSHPTLAPCEEVVEFLTNKEANYTPKDADFSSNKVVSFFKNSISSVKKEDDNDPYFVSLKGQIVILEDAIEKLYKSASVSVSKMKAVRVAETKLGEILAAFADRQNTLCHHLNKNPEDEYVIRLANEISETLENVVNEEDVSAKIFGINVIETMKDYMLEIESIKEMIAARDKILSDYLSLSKKIASKKTDELEAQFEKCSTSLTQANLSCIAEYERTKTERNFDLSEMIESIIQLETDLHKKLSETWYSTAVKLNFAQKTESSDNVFNVDREPTEKEIDYLKEVSNMAEKPISAKTEEADSFSALMKDSDNDNPFKL